MQSQFNPRLFEAAHGIPARAVAERLGVAVRQQGSRGWACCPLHREKTPSLVFYPDGGFKCWGCGAAGDSIDLCAAYYNLDKLEAARRICSDFGLEEPTEPISNAEETRKKTEQRERERQSLYVKNAHDMLAWAWRTLRGAAPISWDTDKLFWALLWHQELIDWLIRTTESLPMVDRYEFLAPYESVVTLIGQYRQFAGSSGRKTMGRHRDRYASSYGA